MMSSFQPGDVVQLKSGGPEMTIADIGDYSGYDSGEQSANCIWFDNKKQNSHVFPLHTLKKVNPE
ncbi:DUF2158 domain-containing protein [Alicycliphilus denitrificans]|uniref:DUF2158 domain-containing protein n=2 Tax=Alicycliphilus denitrificans TaxID=179636 RepID=A0A3R7LGU5_9BURK|nr:DUF2158 domain-containing protein [Alicycliphilus denitrificans]